MKTESPLVSNVQYRRGLLILLARTKYVAAVSLVLAALLLTCYSAVTGARRTGVQEATSAADVLLEANENDSDYLEKRREFLNRFFGRGPGGVSPSEYTSALATARALPPSELLQGRTFSSPDAIPAMRPWTFPISPPIRNSYGGNASAQVNVLAIDPLNANTVYSGSFGGVAKTTDGGGTWRYLSDTWLSQSVSSIAVNPNASTDVYVGTGREDYGPYGVGLYRSFNGGTTWSTPLGSAQFAGTSIRNIAIDPNASGGGFTATLYVANGGSNTCGLWRSTNSGTTWTRLRQVQNGIYDVAIDSSTHPATLYITEDGGTFKSTNSGTSWTLIHTVLAESRNRLSVVNGALYLIGPGDPEHNLYKSLDRGANWIQIPTRCFDGADSCAPNGNGNIGFSVFAVDPFNPQVILAGNQALYRTDNEGLTWTEIGHWWGDPDPTRSIHTDQKVIAISKAAPGIAYEGNDGGVVRTTDGGVRWTNLNQNLPGALMYSVALSANGSMMGGTQDNGSAYSNLGTSWHSFQDGDSAHNLIDPIGNTWAYKLSYGRDSFYRFNRQVYPYQFYPISPAALSHDGGCAFFPPFSMNPSQPEHLIAACQHVVRTLDGTTVTPSSWTTIGPSLADPNRPPNANGNYVTAAYQAPNNSNVIYAVREYDTVFVTTNADQGGGAAWTQVTQKNQPGGISNVIVDPSDFQIAYLACDSAVYKTTDTGRTWTRQGIANLIYHDVAIDPANPRHIFAASNAGVFGSTDGGITWANMSDGIPAGMVVSSLSFNAVSRQLAASTYGRGVYMLSLAVATQ
jgi:photosystem II stability/assembly factor-like uncharacterized protein